MKNELPIDLLGDASEQLRALNLPRIEPAEPLDTVTVVSDEAAAPAVQVDHDDPDTGGVQLPGESRIAGMASAKHILDEEPLSPSS